MSPFYATYAGMLDYMAREFEGLALTDTEHASQLRRNAEILAHMAAEFGSGHGPDGGLRGQLDRPA
ncbi:hypothetical protein STAQ_30600 [Allostella sp. ATCC 35155]|nr:hypothetical protein STAQ_30600 [Stella sp. ATCC 35155]